MLYKEETDHKNKLNLKIVLLCLSVIIFIELTDNVVGNVSDFQYEDKYNFLKFFLASHSSIIFFTILSSAFIAIQFIFLYFIEKHKELYEKDEGSIRKITLYLHIFLICILVTVILTVLLTSSYPFILSKVSIGIGSIMASLIFFLLGYKFIKWYITSRNKILFLFFGSFVLLGLTKTIFEAGIFFSLYNNNEIIIPSTTVEFPDYTINPFLSFFQDSYWIFATASFALLWLSIVLLFHKYRTNLGIKKYYTIIILSILIFIPTPFGIYLNQSDIGNIIDPVLFYTLTSFNATIAAILFFITFFTFSKDTDNGSLKRYLTLTGIGLLLYFVSDQATIEQHAFPPYGLISVTFLGYSAFLIYKGLLSSAILLSRDNNLRKLIHSQMKDKFLYDISLGEVYEKNEKLIANKIIRNNIEDPSLDWREEQIDTKKIINDVMESLLQIKDEEDRKKGFFTLLLNCNKCRILHKIQTPLQGSIKELSPDTMYYPDSEEFSCIGCGTMIGLANTRKVIT